MLGFFKKVNQEALLSSALYDNDTFYRAFEHDLSLCQHEAIIESPFITTRRLSMLLPILHKLTSRANLECRYAPDIYRSSGAGVQIYSLVCSKFKELDYFYSLNVRTFTSPTLKLLASIKEVTIALIFFIKMHRMSVMVTINHI